VLDAHLFCHIGDIFALLHLDLGAHLFPEVGDREDGVCARESATERLLVFCVGLEGKSNESAPREEIPPSDRDME
jgi:hypothetical protein